jgi:hypothetical protein
LRAKADVRTNPGEQPSRSGLSQGHGLSKAIILGGLTAVLLAGSLWAFTAGEMAGICYLLALAGHIWLLVLIARDCPPETLICAVLIPFFTWFWALKRRDIAIWPLLCNVGGLALFALYRLAASAGV